MKQKMISLLWIFLILVLAACNRANQMEPGANIPPITTPPSEEIVIDEPEVDKSTPEIDPAIACPAAPAGAHLLVDAARGICFHYPENYGVFQGDDGGYTLYVRSLMNTEAPLVSFIFIPAGGHSLNDFVAQSLATFSLPASDIYDVTLDGKPAIMLDNFPGQDTNRRLLVLYNDQVIEMMVARIGPEYGEVGFQAESLYKTITESFQFIAPVAGAPLQAGPECPVAAEGQNLYTNAEDGYCLLLPDGYAVDDSLTTDHGGAETAIYVGSLMDVAHPRLFITVTDARGQTLDVITADREAELEADLPEFEVSWSFGHMLDGIAANQFDQVPGQDFSRQVVLVYNGRLYTLTFIPDDETAGDAYAEMQSLYDLVMDSFSFTGQPPVTMSTGQDPMRLARWYLEQEQADYSMPAGWPPGFDPASVSSSVSAASISEFSPFFADSAAGMPIPLPSIADRS